ncbi:CACTA en-spm transposon protein [Cucumis melo var. makuwa]|uniref:CACTA en-spm transposon protein n=1 Tax=Cucumis melo var. makuwa TaxID=1194695 RepID=A0A5A7TMA0_CUCMM|nr:CACTA en-spm transposon protein [Cucumis melo var. makuwa]
MAGLLDDNHEAKDEFGNFDPLSMGSSTRDTSDGSSMVSRIRGYSRNIELDKHVERFGRIPIEMSIEFKKLVDVIEMAKSQVQSTKDGQQCGLIELFKKTHAKDDNWVNKASHAAHSRMVELEGLQTLEGSQPPSEEEICEIVLGRHPGGPKSKPRKHRYSSKSISSIKQKAYEQEIEIRNLKEQLDMKKSNIQEEREVRNATKEKLMTKKEELMATKTEVDNLKELMKQFMASQEGTSK